jgi:hypothetical protein
MVFPEKLPFAAIAVGIAAAVQAATTTTFFPACAWGLVILATALEVTWHISDNQNRWPKLIIRSVVVIFLVPIVSFLAYQAYRREYDGKYLYVAFDVPHPPQVGTDNLELNYVLLNNGISPILVEKVTMLETVTTDFTYNPHRNIELCNFARPFFRSERMREFYPPTDGKVYHLPMNRPTLPVATLVEGVPPFPDDGKIDVASYAPKTLLDNGKDVIGAISIDAGKATSLTASFEMDPVSWEAPNVVILCGGRKYLQGGGIEIFTVCPAWILAHDFRDGKPFVQLFGPASPTGFNIVPGKENLGECKRTLVKCYWSL